MSMNGFEHAAVFGNWPCAPTSDPRPAPVSGQLFEQ